MGKITDFIDAFLQKSNRFWIGLIPGLLFPPTFIWLYLNQFSPIQTGVIDTILAIYPSMLLGKILLLSAFPNMALLFVFYKTDSFKLAIGILTGGMPYFIAGIFML